MNETNFSKSSDLTITKVDETLGLVFGFAVVCKLAGEDYYDLAGDHIPEKAMMKAAMRFMERDRVAKEQHAGDPIGTIVFAYPLTEEVAKMLDIETKQTGLLIAMKPSDPEMLKRFASGELTGFSIGGKRVKDTQLGA
jgi:hypothetical protein